MSYLLSTQFLLDLMGSKPQATAWRDKVPTRSIEISVISIGQVMQQIDKHARASDRDAMKRDLRRIEASVDMPSYQGIVAFEADAARVWSRLIDVPLEFARTDGSRFALSLASKMVVATALTRSATLVEGPQPYHAMIADLSVEHP
jgi:predicted nucleic acid-binding protein